MNKTLVLISSFIRIFIIAYFTIISASVSSASELDFITVGIIPFSGKDKEIAENANSKITHNLSKYKFIKIAERAKLKDILKEIEISQTGLINSSTTLKTGNISGIKILITGTILNNNITARAIQAETAKVIISSSIDNLNAVDKLCKEIAIGIDSYMARENLRTMKNKNKNIDFKFWITHKVDSKTEKEKKNHPIR